MIACERAKTWLAEALDHGEIDRIAEMKAQAEAIRVYTISKQLGKDAEASASEIVRRAERGLGILTRRGQNNGSIRAKGEGYGPYGDYERGGKTVSVEPRNADTRSSPSEYVGRGGTRVDIYSMTDGVTDSEFDDVIGEARDEGNLTRKHVADKLRERKRRIPDPSDRSFPAITRRRELMREWAGKRWTTRQIAARLGCGEDHVRRTAKEHGFEIPADAVMGRQSRIDSNRVVENTVSAMEGLASGLQLVILEDLDASQAKEWAASLAESARGLNRLIKQLKELAQ